MTSKNTSTVSTSQPLLILTSTPESGTDIGTLYLKSLIKSAPELKFQWHAEMPFLGGQRLSKIGKVGSLLRSALVRISYWSTLRLFLFKKLAKANRLTAIKNYHIDKNSIIILTASSPELISIGKQLALEGFKIIVIVWDAPEYLALNLRLDGKQTKKLLCDFSDLMSGARSAAVISEEMRSRYKKEYHLPCDVIRHGISQRYAKNIKSQSNELKIVFAGSLYSKEEWNALINSLNLSDWTLNGIPVRLIFIGKFPLAGATRPHQMQHLATMPLDKTLELMSEMDIGYLPYWFDPKYEIVAKTSFPGKLTAYAAAGLLVFHHGPAYSSVTGFFTRYPFGTSCHSLDPNEIRKNLQFLATLHDEESVKKARSAAIENELSEESMAISFRKLLSSVK